LYQALAFSTVQRPGTVTSDPETGGAGEDSAVAVTMRPDNVAAAIWEVLIIVMS
jgi:hypothetical protein